MSAGACKDCSDCSCDQTTCDDDKAPAPVPSTAGAPVRRSNDTRYLTQGRKKGPRPDATPLEGRCCHYGAGSALRSQCTTCIASWVVAVGRDEAEEAAAEYDRLQRRIAAQRIRRAIGEHLLLGG